MGNQTAQRRGAAVWMLAARQHDVAARRQLLELGLSSQAIKHRVAKGRLHPLHRGVYAVGSPHITRLGEWMAATLRCGDHAVLSHESAAALWGIRPDGGELIDVSVAMPACPRCPDLRVHRRKRLGPLDVTIEDFIPVTTPVRTILDIAPLLSPHDLEASINEADKRDLVNPVDLRSAVAARAGERGARALRTILDRRTFRLTDSELERRFLRLARRAGLPMPSTGRWVNGFKVDFFWPELGLVVETDGLRYHRTPAQQAKDRLRDQAHAAAGFTPLRFTHAQVAFGTSHVATVLRTVATRLGAT